MRFRSLTLLGSTGSIGRQTLDVVRQFRSEFQVVALSATGRQLDLFAAQIREFEPAVVHLAESSRLPALRALVPNFRGEFLLGADGLRQVASEAPADLVLVATVGWTGLEPALGAIAAGRHIALANKEVLVCGGHLVTAAVQRQQVLLLPVDSEHNAIFQCLAAAPGTPLRRLILTCSGGPFRQATQQAIDSAPPAVTLRHPTWDMGAKISVDSATLMNKGFEVIEAHHLFQVPYDQIEVIVHPQSTIHSMVEFVDGNIIAQLGQTDMRIPIQYALTYPERRPSATPSLDFSRLQQLTFEAPDVARFPCLQMAYAAGNRGGTAPCVLNAANEVAVGLHLDNRIPCGAIPRILARVMEEHDSTEGPSLAALQEADRLGRAEASRHAAAFCW
jgi:1-deoxy-D-xylulose-5-phosphate reductoisomerase